MKNKKKLSYIVSCICVLAMLVGVFAMLSSAAEPITKYNYFDAAGVASNVYTRGKWSRVGAADADQKAVNALEKVGSGMEYTFGLSLNLENINGTPTYNDMSIQAFVPELTSLGGALTAGYGVRLSLMITSAGVYQYQFYPRYANSESEVGTKEVTVSGTSGTSGANNTGLQAKVLQNITDANLKNKMAGNGEVINITIGFKTHAIEGDTVTVEYYMELDGIHQSSVYTKVNTATSYYKNGTELVSNSAYNALAGGGLVFYSSGIKVGGATPTSSQYNAVLSDVRQMTLVPEVDTDKGMMLINGQTGNVAVSGPATAVVTAKPGYDVAGIMAGTRFIPAPAAVNGAYTFSVTASEFGNVTIKPMFVKKADMLDYGTEGSITGEKGKGAQCVMIADDSDAAHNTEFDMKVTFTDNPNTSYDLKMVQIGAFLKGDGTVNSPYNPEYGFLVKLSNNVVYLCTYYGRTVDGAWKDAQLDASYTGGSDSGYGWAKKLFDTKLAYGDTIELGLGEIQVDENNIIYYIRLNGEVIVNVPIDLSKKLTIENKYVVDSQNHVGNRVAFTPGDTEIVTISSNKTKVDSSAIDFTDIQNSLPAGTWASVPEQYFVSQNGERITAIIGGRDYKLEAAITETAPKLGQGIGLYYTAIVNNAYENPVLSYVYDGKTYEVSGKALGTKGDFTTYEFVINIFPQDVCDNVSATLKSGEVELCKMPSFSMQSYCRNLLDKIAAGEVADGGLRQLLISVLFYGDAAQRYFDGAEAPNCTAVLTDTEKALYSAAIGDINSVLAGANVKGFTWKEATLLLQDHPVVRFYFDTEWTDVTVKVNFDGKEYTYGIEDIKNWGTTWYFDFDEL